MLDVYRESNEKYLHQICFHGDKIVLDSQFYENISGRISYADLLSLILPEINTKFHVPHVYATINVLNQSLRLHVASLHVFIIVDSTDSKWPYRHDRT